MIGRLWNQTCPSVGLGSEHIMCQGSNVERRRQVGGLCYEGIRECRRRKVVTASRQFSEVDKTAVSVKWLDQHGVVKELVSFAFNMVDYSEAVILSNDRKNLP